VNIQRNLVGHQYAQGFHTLHSQDLNAMTISEMTDLLTLTYLLECRQDEYPSLVSFDGQRVIVWAKMPDFEWFAESVSDDEWHIWVRTGSGEIHATA
jgi:hypothetical protein